MQGIVFDFDGIIVDTELPIYNIWASLYESYGFQLAKEKWRQAIGTRNNFDPIRDLNSLLAQSGSTVTVGGQQYDEIQTRIKHYVNGPVQPVDGVVDWLEQANQLGLRVGIASSSPVDWLNNYISRLGLEHHFEAVVGVSDELRPKPYSDVYKAACDILEIEPKNSMAVEDSRFGLLAAKAIDMKVVVMPSVLTAGDDFALADLMISDFCQTTLDEVIKCIV